MQDGKILYTLCENTCIIKMVGKIVYKISPDFDRFLQKINTIVNIFIVDLTETEYIDSTNLGLIAKLRSISNSRSGTTPILISPNNNINELFQNVGFFKLFNIVDNWKGTFSNFQELPHSEYTKTNLGEVMLQAHKDLANLNEESKIRFKDVIDFLSKEIEGNTTSAF